MGRRLGPALIEPIAARGWPANACGAVGGWRLYAASGLSGRLNTCWPLSDPGLPADEAIALAESWYAARGMPCRFKLADGCTDPPDLAERLAALGYVASVATLTMVGPLHGAREPDVVVAPRPGPGFCRVFAHHIFGAPDDADE